MHDHNRINTKRGLNMRKTLLASTIAAVLTFPGFALAQGIPTFDNANFLKAIESISNQMQQIQKLQSQIEEAQKLYGSMNKLTDISSLASILNDPLVKNALPNEFSQIENLLKGQGGGSGPLGGFADAFKKDNTYYESEANTFYNEELKKAKQQSAGYAGVGRSIYESAGKKLEGITQLKNKIATAKDQKEILDLQARLQAESAGIQIDFLKMQGIAMVQQAQLKAEAQREKEHNQKMIETFESKLK